MSLLSKLLLAKSGAETRQRTGREAMGQLSALAQDRRGSILLETVVAVIIFSLVGTAVLAGLSTAYTSGSITETQSVAENIARNQMESVFNQPYREPLQTPYPNISVPSNYGVSTTVAYANAGSPDPEAERITVTASHDGKNILTLETLRGRTDGMQLRYSAVSDRSNSARLAGQTIGGTVYVFLDDPTLLADNQTEFFLDGFGPITTENFIHWDFKGTTGIGPLDPANPWDTTTDPSATNGAHRITARTLLNDDNTVNVTADFNIFN